VARKNKAMKNMSETIAGFFHEFNVRGAAISFAE
jgi:hypothetical protein